MIRFLTAPVDGYAVTIGTLEIYTGDGWIGLISSVFAFEFLVNGGNSGLRRFQDMISQNCC